MIATNLTPKRTGKPNNAIRAEVMNGIAKGWTAKETSYQTGIKVDILRYTAKKMNLAFIWTKAGSPPAKGDQPMSVKTLLRRDKHTIDTILTALNKLLKRMPPDSPHQLEVMKILSFVRMRRNPPRWIHRVK